MNPLTPEEVRNDASQRTEESLERSAAAATKEAEITRRLNLIRQSELEIQKQYQAETDKIIKEGEARKLVLKSETESLEARKLEALKPVQQHLDKAREMMDATEERGKKIDAKELDLKKREELLVDRAESITEYEQKLVNQKDVMAKRENRLVSAEQEVKFSTEKLSAKWLEFHGAIARQNIEMQNRERVVTDMTKANTDRATMLTAKELEIVEKDRALTDKYQNLMRAIDEFEAKKKLWQMQKKTQTT